MAKRKLLVSLKKGETENSFSRHVSHERDSESVNERSIKINKQDPIYTFGEFREAKPCGITRTGRTS
jgi:hypothetical protein